MNKMLQEQVKILQNISGAMGAQAGAAQQAAEANQKVGDTAKTAADQTRDMTDAIKENTGGADALAGAMGRSSEQTSQFSSNLEKGAKTAGLATAALGALAAAQSGIAEATAAAQGSWNLFTGGLTSGFGILKAGVGVVGGFFGSLMSAAAQYYNTAGREMFEANQDLIEQFGNLDDTQGKFVKDMAKDLGTAQSALGGANNSLFAAIGNSAAILKEMTALAGDFGNDLVAMQDQIAGATSELLLMKKGMGLSADAMKNLASTSKATGGDLGSTLQDGMVASAHLSKQFGVDVKIIGKGMSEMAGDMENFGHLGVKEMAAVATYSAKLGVEIKDLQGLMGAFDTFEDAAANAGKLAEAFGMNVDAMAMMNEENPAKRMDMLRESLAETGKSFEDLSRHEKKLMAQTAGMDMKSLQNAMSVDVDEMGFDDFGDAAEEAAESMTPEQAMQDVAESIKKMSHAMTDMANGPLSNFMKGFMQVLNRSPEFRDLMKTIGKFLKEFFHAGKAVAHLFLKFLRGPGKGILGQFKEIFNLKRIRKFLGTVKEAFGEFFKLLKTDPKKAVENLFDKIFGAFKDWFASGPTTTGMGEMLKNLLITGLKLVAGLAPKIIKAAAGFIADFAKTLGEFLNNDKGVTGALGDGIGGAFMEAFNAIKDAVVNDLGPALMDLFMVLFKKFGPPIIGVLSAIWTVIFIKSIVSAALSAAAGALVQAAVMGLGTKLGKMMGKADPSGGKVDPKKTRAQAGNTKSMAEGLNDMMKGLAKIKPTTIGKAAFNMFLMAASLIPAMVALAVGLVIVAFVLAPVPFVLLIKALMGLVGAIVAVTMMMGALKIYEKVSGGAGGMVNTIKGMLAMAVVLAVGGVALGVAAILMMAVWTKIPIMGVLKAVATITAMSFAVMAMLVPTLILGAVITGPGGLVVLAGLAGMALVLFASLAMAPAATAFGAAFADVPLVPMLKGLFVVAAMSMAMVGLVIAAAVIGVVMAATLGLALAGLWGMGKLAGWLGGDGGKMFAQGAIDFGAHFKDVDLVQLGKAILVTAALAVMMMALVIGGTVLAAMSPLMLVAIVGLKAADWFIWGAAGAIGNMVEEIVKIPISDPDKVMKKITLIGKIVSIVGTLADLGLKAAKMSIVASLFSGKDPADMMKSISGFVGDIIDHLIKLVGALVKAAQSLGADPKTLKGAEAVAGMIGAVAQLAGALIGPLTSLESDGGAFLGFGDSMSDKLRAVATSMGDILDALKDKLVGKDGMIVSLLAVFDNPVLKKEKPETLKARADTLKSLFGALLALINSMSKLQEFEQEDTAWLSDNSKSASEVLGALFEEVRKILKMPSLSGVIRAAVDLTKIVKAEDADKIKKQADALKAIMEGMKGVIFAAGDIGRFFGSITDPDSGGYQLWYLKTTLDEMEQLQYLPSQVIPRIVEEATKIAAGMKKMEADFSMVDLKPQLDGILGYDGEHRITIAPEAVNLTVKLQVAIDAEELAVTMHKSNKTKFDGFFKTTEKAGSSLLEGWWN